MTHIEVEGYFPIDDEFEYLFYVLVDGEQESIFCDYSPGTNQFQLKKLTISEEGLEKDEKMTDTINDHMRFFRLLKES